MCVWVFTRSAILSWDSGVFLTQVVDTSVACANDIAVARTVVPTNVGNDFIRKVTKDSVTFGIGIDFLMRYNMTVRHFFEKSIPVRFGFSKKISCHFKKKGVNLR